MGSVPSAGAAFSDPFAYSDAPEAGGGGGRWFTGSTADGYGCESCHEGGNAVDLSVAGLPLEGYTPGASYDVSVSWPLTAQNVALLAEFTDEQRLGAGTVELPLPQATSELELCSGEEAGFPSSDKHEAENGRQLLSVIDCGARLLRFQWTAPFADRGTVWFNVGFVNSDESAEPAGDGVTMVSRPLQLAGTDPGEQVIAEGCSALAPGRRGHARLGWDWALGVWALYALRRSKGVGHAKG